MLIRTGEEVFGIGIPVAEAAGMGGVEILMSRVKNLPSLREPGWLIYSTIHL